MGRREIALLLGLLLVAGAACTGPDRPEWYLVALGDSTVTDAGCAGCTPYPERYRRELADIYRVEVTAENLGVGGATSHDVLASLSDWQLAAEVRRADVVTLTVGANDFAPVADSYRDGHCGGADGLSCFDAELAQLGVNLGATLRRIGRLRAGLPTAVRVTGYWNVFLDGAVGLAGDGPAFVAGSAALTRKANAVISSAAAAGGATYVDLYAPFKGADGRADPTPLLAPDGDHPSQLGHQVITDALLRSGLAPLRDTL